MAWRYFVLTVLLVQFVGFVEVAEVNVEVTDEVRKCMVPGDIAVKLNLTEECTSQNVSHVTTPVQWSKKGMNAQNNLRQLHGSSPLVLNNDLCKSAQWLANLLLCGNLTSQNVTDSALGIGGNCSQNIWISPTVELGSTGSTEVLGSTANTSVLAASRVVGHWYSQVRHYKFNKVNDLNLTQVQAFANIVWRATKEGCIVYAKSGNASYTYVVAQYFPAGSTTREDYRKNVRPTMAGPGSENFGAKRKSCAVSSALLLLLTKSLEFFLLKHF